MHGRGRQRQQQHRENRSNLAQCPDPPRFGLLLTTDHIPKPNLPATWDRSEGRNERSRVFLSILEKEKLIMELYPLQIDPNSSGRTNTRTCQNVAVGIRRTASTPPQKKISLFVYTSYSEWILRISQKCPEITVFSEIETQLSFANAQNDPKSFSFWKKVSFLQKKERESCCVPSY